MSASPSFLVARILNEDIKKPTPLVHFERRLSSLEQRIMTLMLFAAQSGEGASDGTYTLDTRFIRDFIGWKDSKNYPSIYAACRRIKGTDLKWNLLNRDKTVKAELVCSLIITLGIEHGSGKIRFKFHPDLVALIRDPNVFAKLKLIMVSLLASPKHAYSLYELVAEAFCRGEVPFRIPYHQLLSYLGLSDSAYRDDWKSFRKRVFTPSLKQIDKLSDYHVTYTTYRSGRKIAGLDLEIHRKKTWQPPLPVEPIQALEKHLGYSPQRLPISKPKAASGLHAKFEPYGITGPTIDRAIQRFGEHGVEEIRQYVLAREAKQKLSSSPIQDISAYMAKCLYEGHGVKTQQERVKLEERKKRRAEITERQNHRNLQAEAQEVRKRQTREFISALPPNALEHYRARFAEEVLKGRWGSFYKAGFHEKAWQMSGIKTAFNAFMAEEIDEAR